jgi:hypothetical protein
VSVDAGAGVGSGVGSGAGSDACVSARAHARAHAHAHARARAHAHARARARAHARYAPAIRSSATGQTTPRARRSSTVSYSVSFGSRCVQPSSRSALAASRYQ